MKLAEAQSQAMASRNKLDHDVKAPLAKRLNASGYPASVAVENVSAGYHTLAEAFSGWRDSPPHRANMLKNGVTKLGIAASYAPNTKYKVFWTLILASTDSRDNRRRDTGARDIDGLTSSRSDATVGCFLAYFDRPAHDRFFRSFRAATTPAKAQRVLVLQGGGALGSYQAGAYQALCHYDFEPEWVAGISIGAINAAIIAGNAPRKAGRRA